MKNKRVYHGRHGNVRNVGKEVVADCGLYLKPYPPTKKNSTRSLLHKSVSGDTIGLRAMRALIEPQFGNLPFFKDEFNKFHSSSIPCPSSQLCPAISGASSTSCRLPNKRCAPELCSCRNQVKGLSSKMSSTNSTAAAYPAQAPNSAQQYQVQAPPPAGYPTRDVPQNSVPVETKSKGDGFWKGCCAALCCCCVLDACF
ncbi:PREDICTED: cysteine-rich [Prunus dulcis]|uniref:PREDICTED: cysteine-rich n=3 Tax=Prunus TaxID=3754 RepID=A0A5E4FJ58_PRUDU|nr:PREDICTED: cysteine-rich [Prunus dulcis]